MLIDLCRHYFNHDPPVKNKYNREEYILFKYTNGYFEDINLAHLRNLTDILDSY